MFDWPALLKKPDELANSDKLESWFTRLATAILNGARLWAGNEPHRFTEVEIYYHGPGHPDPFAHRDPVQLDCGRWYFHRTGGVYRSGSFKGLDLAFGQDKAF